MSGSVAAAGHLAFSSHGWVAQEIAFLPYEAGCVLGSGEYNYMYSWESDMSAHMVVAIACTAWLISAHIRSLLVFPTARSQVHRAGETAQPHFS